MVFANGRIGRKEFWKGMLKLFLIALIPAILFQVLQEIAVSGSGNAAEYYIRHIQWLTIYAWFNLGLFLVFAVPTASLKIRRRHDRNKSGIDVKIYFGWMLILYLITCLTIGSYQVDFVQGGVVPTLGVFDYISMSISSLFSLYLLVVLGFLKGTPEANEYGAPPVHERPSKLAGPAQAS